MKHCFLFFLFAVSCLLACNNNTPTTAAHEDTNATVKTTGSSAQPASANDITGNWKLAIDAFDRNSDGILQDEERKKGIPNNYHLQLNADGTCRMQNIFTGRYTIKTENGNKVLTIQRKRIEDEEDKDPLPDIFHIKSVTRNELILLVMEAGDGTTFWIFKRV